MTFFCGWCLGETHLTHQCVNGQFLNSLLGIVFNTNFLDLPLVSFQAVAVATQQNSVKEVAEGCTHPKGTWHHGIGVLVKGIWTL